MNEIKTEQSLWEAALALKASMGTDRNVVNELRRRGCWNECWFRAEYERIKEKRSAECRRVRDLVVEVRTAAHLYDL